MAKAVTLKALREREAAQVPPRLGVRIVAVFVVLQILLLAALMMLFPAKAGAAPVKGDIAVNTAAATRAWCSRSPRKPKPRCGSPTAS